jgi:hypothetical protein
MITIFSDPHSFAIADAMSKWVAFNTLYFTDHVIISMYQCHLEASADIVCHKLQNDFDNSPSHTAAVVVQEMQRLRCEHISHPAYSPHLAVHDFNLFGWLKQQLCDITAETSAGLIDEVTRALATLAIAELRSAFDHWIERSDWVQSHSGKYYHE